jgi:hypothetical protein
MVYSKMKLANGQLVPTMTKVINQSTLTSDCWLVQFEGLSKCKTCEAKGTKDCGGGETLKRLKAEAKKGKS